MGKPKFSRKKFNTPSHPWQEVRIKAENEFIKKYGLKNKREIWKAETKLGKYRTQARELLAKVGTDDVQSKKESDQLLSHLNRMNILPAKSTLDDVLALETESILSRRLQTQTYLKGLANTPEQARQLISHGHIAINNKRVTIPGYMVTKEEEGEITYTSDSPLNDTMHPARPRAEYKGVPIKRDVKQPEQKGKEEKPKTAKEPEKPTPTPDSKTVEPDTKDKTEEKSEEKGKEEKVEKQEKTSESEQSQKEKPQEAKEDAKSEETKSETQPPAPENQNKKEEAEKGEEKPKEENKDKKEEKGGN
jgi:small subunit ribosomal protein S4